MESGWNKGVEIISPDAARIWKESRCKLNLQIFDYLSILYQIKHIIIESYTLSSNNKIENILKYMNWL